LLNWHEGVEIPLDFLNCESEGKMLLGSQAIMHQINFLCFKKNLASIIRITTSIEGRCTFSSLLPLEFISSSLHDKNCFINLSKLS
jgi:hypothetical protein